MQGCETWPLPLKEHRLTAFVSRILRKIFGLTGDEVTGGWRRPAKYYCQIMGDEMGELCGLQRGEKKCIHGYGGKT